MPICHSSYNVWFGTVSIYPSFYPLNFVITFCSLFTHVYFVLRFSRFLLANSRHFCLRTDFELFTYSLIFTYFLIRFTDYPVRRTIKCWVRIKVKDLSKKIKRKFHEFHTLEKVVLFIIQFNIHGLMTILSDICIH